MYAITKNNTKKKKSELELKLICLLLIAGNAIALKELDIIDFGFVSYAIEGAIVASAVVIAAGIAVSIAKFFKTA